ncbi:MAG: hypothetical protein A2W03_02630 [Candidatus Aminicenantes bacterium RBG_16_63_16]|nr:MAG: hypothetical protein A2W03_02630 [Candidatus Aminicenantes bacterium RBG_16_63_16]
MTGPDESALRKGGRVAFMLLVWGITVWLIFPLVFLKDPSLQDATKYFYRSALGITMLIILYGKTLFDLFFPLDTSRGRTVAQVVFLTLYALGMTGGIIFVLFRIFALFIKGGSAGVNF